MLAGSILITGGTGTLGHAIVEWSRKMHRNCTFTIFSRSELRQAEMAAEYPDLRYILGDVRDEAQVCAAVAGHDIVIHAAAMKRIPECEAFPIECYQTNVQGTINVARACVLGRVKRCVGISTDKACAAITTYGASKKALEGIFQQASQHHTMFTLVRYGNVVASNGSVIPLWRKQARAGHPLTLTGGEMTRFWMSRFDAVALIDRALHMPEGTISIPKMGSLSIRDMANFIAPGAETIDVGVRSCEKTHEDLVHPDEGAMDEGPLYYTIRPELRQSGISYTSFNAPRLHAQEFLDMLEVA